MAYVSMGEAHPRVTDFLSRFDAAVESLDGPSLRRLLLLPLPPPSLRRPPPLPGCELVGEAIGAVLPGCAHRSPASPLPQRQSCGCLQCLREIRQCFSAGVSELGVGVGAGGYPRYLF